MGYTALYRKFRPTTFSEVVGQEHITQTLKNQIMANRVGHAYLFSGGRGTGKTSSAKILARAINCLNPKDGEPCNECEICKAALNGSLTDIVEMDAASNNSVEDIRSIREEVNFLPTKAKYRVYIIDEVHMLSPGAFNALLKTLEEPPEHVKFILATTEPQKLPATILSRCQRFDFKRISNENIVKRLKDVCKESKIEATDGALSIIATLADGAMRDALSILERCVQDGENKIDENKIKDLVGIPKITFVHNIVDSIIEYDVDRALTSMDEILNQGKDLTNFLWEIIKYVKDVLVYKSSGKAELYSKEEIENIKNLADKTTKERIVNLIYELSNLENDMKWSTQKTIMFEAGLIKLCSKEISTGENVEERLEKIENYLKSGNISRQQVTATNGVNVVPNVAQNTASIDVPNASASKPSAAFMSYNTSGTNIEVRQTGKTVTKNYSKDLNKSWPAIVNDLKQNGKMVLYTSLKGTTAEQINDTTVAIKFNTFLSGIGKTVLNKQENVKELTNLLSNACGKNVQIRYVEGARPQAKASTPADDIQKLANDSGIPFNIEY